MLEVKKREGQGVGWLGGRVSVIVGWEEVVREGVEAEMLMGEGMTREGQEKMVR